MIKNLNKSEEPKKPPTTTTNSIMCQITLEFDDVKKPNK